MSPVIGALLLLACLPANAAALGVVLGTESDKSELEVASDSVKSKKHVKPSRSLQTQRKQGSLLATAPEDIFLFGANENTVSLDKNMFHFRIDFRIVAKAGAALYSSNGGGVVQVIMRNIRKILKDNFPGDRTERRLLKGHQTEESSSGKDTLDEQSLEVIAEMASREHTQWVGKEQGKQLGHHLRGLGRVFYERDKNKGQGYIQRRMRAVAYYDDKKYPPTVDQIIKMSEFFLVLFFCHCL